MAVNRDSSALLEARISDLEKKVAANIVQLAALERTVETVSKPTNWFVIIGTIAGSLSAMIVFVNLIAGPIDSKLTDLKGDENSLRGAHDAFLARFDDHVRDGHPESVKAIVEANKQALLLLIQADKDAGVARDATNLERIRELYELRSKEIDRLREQIDTYETGHATVKKP